VSIKKHLLIIMAAPTRNAPQRVSSQRLLSRANDPSAIYSAPDNAVSTPPMVISRPGKVRTQGDVDLEKFAQLIMYIVALIAIWGGIFSIAFDDNATNSQFLLLFIGGFVSAAMAIAWIELQSKKNAHQLMEVQNYMLGLGFFFATVGTLWGARYLMGFATGTLDLELFGNPNTYVSDGADWQPNANGIYMQVIAVIALLYGEIKLLNRYKGATTFGWGVAIYSPLALMVTGVGPWIDWSNSIVSYELGLAIIVLSFVSMEAALRSNKSMHFFVVAIVSGIVPIIYELFNTNAPVGGEGGALSLLIFIIAIQGYYASKQELRSDLMQKASVLLVGEVLIAMFIAGIKDLNLVIGPLKSENLGFLGDHLTLSVMLWVTVLIAYFPAVMQRRVPWMPIGLAFSLFFLPTESNIIPWVITLVMIPYMLFINKNARKWVSDLTVTMLAVSFFMTDLIARVNDIVYADIFSIAYTHYLIPITLVVIAEAGFRQKKISSWAHLSIVSGVTLSRAILGAEEWFLPWVFVAYILYIASTSLNRASKSGAFNDRKESTQTVIIALGATLLLAIFGKLNLPETSFDEILSGFNISLMVLGLGSYFLLRIGREIEFDIGMLLNWQTIKKKSTKFNVELNAWIEVDNQNDEYFITFEQNWLSKSWSSLARISVIIPLILMTIAITEVDLVKFAENPMWAILLTIPVGILVSEILALDKISSFTRSAGVWMLVLMAAPMVIKMQLARVGTVESQVNNLGGLIPSAIVLDLILIAAPFIVNSQINKRGIDVEVLSKNADVAALAGLLVLAMMDSSGGLLLISMFVLATFRAIKHRHNMLLMASPIIFAFIGTTWVEEFGLANTILDSMNINVEYGFFTIANISGWIIAIQMGIVWIMATREMGAGRETQLPWWGSMAWFAVGLIAAMPDASWLPTIFTIMLTGSAIYRGKVSYIPAMPIIFFFSLLWGIGNDSNFSELSGGEVFGWAAITTALFTLALSTMEMTNWLYSKCEEMTGIHQPNQIISITTQEGRTQISDALRIMGIAAFLLSFEIGVGIGPVIASVWVTYIAIRKGSTNGLLLMPLLHGISIANCLNKANIASDDIGQLVVGLLMAIEGGVLIYFSTQNDTVYEWQTFNWDDDNDFLNFMDYLGMGGLLSAISGTWYAFANTNLDSFSWLIMTILFTLVAIQGFSKENDARWRRGFGGFGSLVTAFIFANTLDSDIFTAIGYVFLGILGFGYGAMFSQRIGGEGEIYLAEEQGQSGLLQATKEMAIKQEKQPQLVEKGMPIKQETKAQIVEEEIIIDKAPVVAKPIPEAMIVETPVIHDGLIETADGFAIRLPADVVQNILNSINNTPHQGFKPVLGFSPSGQVVLNFENE
jgi:hypothetical protein